MRINAYFIFTLALAVFITGCSLFSKHDQPADEVPISESTLSTTPQAPHTLPDRSNRRVDQPRSFSQPAVEIIWKGPEGQVDRYIINYGYEETSLGNKIDFATTEIEQYQDPEYGPVFRYYLTDADPKRDLFFNIQALTADTLSEPSRVVRVAAEVKNTLTEYTQP